MQVSREFIFLYQNKDNLRKPLSVVHASGHLLFYTAYTKLTNHFYSSSNFTLKENKLCAEL